MSTAGSAKCPGIPAQAGFGALPAQAPSAAVRVSELREHTEATQALQFRERFLQVLWNEQRLAADLRTSDGRTLEVVSPGTWNVGAGPDFSAATIRLGGQTLHGAVEVHREAGDWWGHGHHRDPRYDAVILHVVWSAPPQKPSAEQPPVLCLAQALDRPWHTLVHELQAELYPYARQVAPGACALRWAATEDQRLRRLLHLAGKARFEDKVRRIHRNGIARGFGQAIFEALFEALGYKNNTDSFRKLARELPLRRLRDCPDATAREAALFGSAGLLPDLSRYAVRPEWRAPANELWDQWWQQGLPRLDLTWNRSGTRPYNSPERRLSAGLAVLERADLAPDSWLGGLATAANSPRDLLGMLRSGLSVSGRWDAFATFAVALPRPAKVLGWHRTHDVIVNALLPSLTAWAWQERNHELALLARRTFSAVPALQSNRLLEEATHRFLVPPSRATLLLKRASLQQGLLEIYRSFCLLLHNDCENCPFVKAPPVDPPGPNG